MTDTIVKFLEHFRDRGIDLYGNEYYIGEQIYKVLLRYKQDGWKGGIDSIGDVLNKEPNSYEVSCMLYILDNLRIIEWGTSIRYHWIDHKLIDIVELLIKILKKDYQNITLFINYDGYSENYEHINKEHIEYIKNILDDQKDLAF